MTKFALFRIEDGLLVPQDIARSLWKADQMHGVATSGALGRAVERAVLDTGRTDLSPARFTVDLFKAPTMDPCRTETTIVREGSRLVLVDAELVQGGVTVARASGLFLKRTENPVGDVWSPVEAPTPPPLDVAPVSEEPRVPIFSSAAGWSQDFAEHQNAGRKQTWQTTLAVVAGEETTPFQGLCGAADSTSMVVNWGDAGVQYINTDITLAISRVPVSREIGLSATSWYSHDGIATGTATVFDRLGPIGTSTVTSLSNARRAVDFTEHDFSAEVTSGA
ncbi:thioesterase family protein [Marmoricola sp. RAF53]|uniref:thioesterase family protein n=1 Tax=Marmoricola sp. RAF53 TaxID=3233059 RepID=UPI003F9CA5C1